MTTTAIPLHLLMLLLFKALIDKILSAIALSLVMKGICLPIFSCWAPKPV
jgi:hypothetical protein